MAYYLITNDQKINLMRSFIEDIGEIPYYVFLGKHVTETSLPEIYDKPKDLYWDAYRNMILGKRVANTDVSMMIRNVPYEANKVFDIYDDDDNELRGKDFYCLVDEGAYYHCYKCLDNNEGANSTSEPDFSHISGANTEVYQTADGYRWKYMFSMDETTADKFRSGGWFPVTSNSTVTASAVRGCIDIILIESAGHGYDNYLTGSFVSADIKIGGNSHIHRISSAGESTTNGFYTGCLLYIASGSGAGEYRTIGNHYSNNSGTYIVVGEELTTITNGSTYEIYPEVEIIGDNQGGTNAVARALVNASSGNSIYRVEMLERGSLYTYASANVVANAVVAVTDVASLRVVLPPQFGHGYDAAKELYANVVAIQVAITNSESNTVVTTNQFQQVGLLKNPLFDNVKFTFSATTGTFTTGETIYEINPLRFGIATINTTSPNVTFSNADFYSALSANTLLYLTDSEANTFAMARVNTVTNTTSIVLTANARFACTSARVFLANSMANAIVSDVVNENNIFVTNCTTFATSDVVVGNTSGVKATISTIARNGNTKAFGTFVQMSKYDLTPIAGSFSNNEYVYFAFEGVNLASAFVHSTLNNGAIIYTTNNTGEFLVGGTNTMIGNTSNASAYITGSYGPELVIGSGDVLFVSNINAVPRTANTESVLLYLNF